jgi:hypothetical protein
VWVRIFGVWREGTITAWVRIRDEPNAPWECQIQAAPGRTPWSGRYVYDPRTIRPRNPQLFDQMRH